MSPLQPYEIAEMYAEQLVVKGVRRYHVAPLVPYDSTSHALNARIAIARRLLQLHGREPEDVKIPVSRVGRRSQTPKQMRLAIYEQELISLGYTIITHQQTVTYEEE